MAAVEEDIDGPTGAVVLDAAGCVVAPGLVDLHTHLRQPGREEAETIETGTRAASLGGYTAVVAMPNTEPALDSAEAVRNVLELAAGATAEVAVAGAITVDRAGERLAPMAELADLGVRLFTDDGAGVQSAGLMRRALDYARGIGVTLAQHCEDRTLAGNGAMHEGEWSSRLGHPGDAGGGRGGHGGPGHRPGAGHRGPHPLPPPVHRGLGGPGAPGQGRGAGGHRRGGPPPLHPDRRLRRRATTRSSRSTRRCGRSRTSTAVKAGLADGTIDAIATDHAPHAPELKDLPFDQAPPGMLGLQTALSLAIGELALPMADLLALLSWQPARHRRARPVPRRGPGRTDRARGLRPTCASSTPRPPGRWTRPPWPAGAATRPTAAGS